MNSLNYNLPEEEEEDEVNEPTIDPEPCGEGLNGIDCNVIDNANITIKKPTKNLGFRSVCAPRGYKRFIKYPINTQSRQNPRFWRVLPY